MDFDYWDRNMAPQQTRTSFTVFASPDHQQLLNGGVSLDDQEELDSIRSIAKFKGKEQYHHTISRRQQQQHQVSTKYDKYSCLRMPNSSPVPVAAASSYRQMRNASPTGSSSIGSPAGSSSRSLHGAAEAICSVCGDGHAKLHYGVIACYGCKGFFRRTLTGGHCVVDKFQRNSCRFCRFNRCLEVGMDPKAVRPDRDLTGKQKVPRVRKRAMDEELINHMMRLQGDDWSRKIPVEAKMLLMQLLNVESKVAKGDTSLQDTSLPSQHSLPMTEACLYGSAGSYSGQQRNVSLKELFEQKPSNTRRTEMCYEPMRMARAEELPRIAHRGAIAAVDWVESLAEMIDCALLDTADKISLVKACYAPLTIFNFSARTAQNTSDPDILCLCSYSFVPRKLPSDFNGSNHLSNNLIDRTLNELVAPLRKLALKEEEVVALKAIICLDPNAKALSQEAERGVAELRDRVQDMLFQVVKELHPTQNAAAVFGNLLLLLPTIATLSGLMCENMQFCQVFGWTDPLLNELFEAADEGHLEGEERKFALFGGEGSASAGAISYSPPMLGDSLHCGNPAEISLYPQQQMSPNSPPRHLASTPSRASSSLSSSQSPNSSSLSPPLSQPAGPSVEKCEMGTQTDAFEQSISSTMEGGGCEFDTAANSSSRVLLYSQQYSAEHSPFQNIFLGEDHNPHQHPNNDEFHTMDSLLFDTTASSTADFFGLMR